MLKPMNANELLHDPIEPEGRSQAKMSFLDLERPANERRTGESSERVPLALAMFVLLLLAGVTLLLATRVISAGPY